jgi:hypothetical protein
LSARQPLDDTRDRFASAWRAGQRPRLEDCLGAVSEPERTALLCELLRIELTYRRQRGEAPTAAEYQQRFPEQTDAVAAVFDETVSLPSNPAAGATPTPTLSALPTAPYTTGNDAGESPIPQSRDEEAGPLFGDYVLLAPLGKGGMGVVYRARQRRANRLVALKVIRPDLLEDIPPERRRDLLDRFQTEARATARIQHDHVVTVYEVGEIDGQPFYSMRYIEGRSLAAW